MHSVHRGAIAWIFTLGIVGLLSSCAVIEGDRSPEPTADQPLSEDLSPPRSSPSEMEDTVETTVENPVETTIITLYLLDDQCLDFAPQPLSVPKDTALAATVDYLLATQTPDELSLLGYRVQHQDRTLTLDIRLSSQSRRSLEALSLCEQTALFGSLQRTLTQHPDWNIDAVNFTQGGTSLQF
ncbi:MAG TPA: hypothetical protein V6D20_14220 [Candidatus Obscuribacterales bacterium]